MQTPTPTPVVFDIANTLSDWLSGTVLGNVVGILGLAVSVAGFIYTLKQVRTAVSSAKAAKDASEATQREVNKIDAIIEFSTVIALMEEIKRHHRGANYYILPDRYSTVKDKLVKLRGMYPNITVAQKTGLQDAIQHFKTMEDSIERGLARKRPSVNVSTANEIISDQIDFLNELLIEIKSKLETS